MSKIESEEKPSDLDTEDSLINIGAALITK